MIIEELLLDSSWLLLVLQTASSKNFRQDPTLTMTFDYSRKLVK